MEAIAVKKSVIDQCPKDDSTLNDNQSSSQILSTQLLETSIQDAILKKEILASKMDLVTSLMKEVEYEEKAAEDAQQDATRKSLDILAKMDERKKALLEAQEQNDMIARKLNKEKGVLADTKVALEHRVADVLEVGDRSLDILNEMREALEKRLSLALKKKEFANEKMQENESLLAYQDTQEKEAVEEYKRLNQETIDNSKLQASLMNHGNAVEMLNEEVCNKFKDVSMLKGELELKESKNAVVDEGQTTSNMKGRVGDDHGVAFCEFNIMVTLLIIAGYCVYLVGSLLLFIYGWMNKDGNS